MLHASDKAITVLVAEALTTPDNKIEAICGQRTYTVGLSNEPNCPECLAILNKRQDHITHAENHQAMPFGATWENDPVRILTLCDQRVIPSSIDDEPSCPECNKILAKIYKVSGVQI